MHSSSSAANDGRAMTSSSHSCCLDFPTVMDCDLRSGAKINPGSSKLLCLSFIYHRNRNTAKTALSSSSPAVNHLPQGLGPCDIITTKLHEKAGESPSALRSRDKIAIVMITLRAERIGGRWLSLS